MFEYPEIKTIANQMQNELIGKTISSGRLEKKNNNMFMGDGNYHLLKGGAITAIEYVPHDIYIKLDNDYGLQFSQGGGKIFFNKTSADIPKNYNIIFDFSDGSSLTYAVMLYTLGVNAVSHAEWQNHISNDQRFDPFDGTSDDFVNFIVKASEGEKTAVKVFLAKNVKGLMSTFAAEILLYAKIYPSTPIHKLDGNELMQIHSAMQRVLTTAYEKGGRVSEYDLYGNKGKYIAMAERKKIGGNCPVCATVLEKNSTGGVTAFCPACQIKKQYSKG
jgi:formamidopyrimidine-DNA glycosylase